MYVNILHAKLLHFYKQGMCFFWFGVVCELQMASYRLETVFKDAFIDFWGFCHTFRAWHVVRSHPDYWTHATVSKQKFNYSFLYLLGLEDQFSATIDTLTTCKGMGNLQKPDGPMRVARTWRSLSSRIQNLSVAYVTNYQTASVPHLASQPMNGSWSWT